MSKLGAAVCASAVAFLACGLTSASATAMPCAPPDAQLVAADAQAEVYIAKEPYYEVGTHEQLGTLRSYRGCVYGSHRSFRLGPDSAGSATRLETITRVTLAGAVVAYEAEDEVLEIEAEFYVVVRDLDSGRVLRKVPTGIRLEAKPYYAGVGPVEEMVVKKDGAVAWIALDTLRSESLKQMLGQKGNLYYDLYALDKTGERLLASGIELDRSSLALAGSMLYWTEAGKPFSAILH